MYKDPGNIVQEYDLEVPGHNGKLHKVRVRISDSAYAGNPEAEIEEARKRAYDLAWNIALRYEAERRRET